MDERLGQVPTTAQDSDLNERIEPVTTTITEDDMNERIPSITSNNTAQSPFSLTRPVVNSEGSVFIDRSRVSTQLNTSGVTGAGRQTYLTPDLARMGNIEEARGHYEPSLEPHPTTLLSPTRTEEQMPERSEVDRRHEANIRRRKDFMIYLGLFIGFFSFAVQWAFWVGFVYAAGDRQVPHSKTGSRSVV